MKLVLARLIFDPNLTCFHLHKALSALSLPNKRLYKDFIPPIGYEFGSPKIISNI